MHSFPRKVSRLWVGIRAFLTTINSFVDQLAGSAVEMGGGGLIAENGWRNEFLLQIVSVTTQVVV